MEFVAISRVSSVTTLALTLLASSVGFGAGWLAHRETTDPLIHGRLVRPSPPLFPLLATGDLVAAERACPGASTSIVADSRYDYRVNRKSLLCLLSAPSTAARLAPNIRIVPFSKDGAPQGFRLFGVQPGSLFARLGLRNGDVIKAVNGSPIESDDTIRAAYQRLRCASYVIVNGERNTPSGRIPFNFRYRLFGGPI